MQENKEKKIKPIKIIYKPTMHIETEPLCYVSDDILKSYTNLYLKPNQMKQANKSYQCYYYNKFFIRSDKHQSHINNCSRAPGEVHNFNNQNLIRYQNNIHAKGDIPFVIYFDFETTAPTDNCFDPKQKKNVCFFLCHDCCFSSRTKTKSYRNPKKLRAFNRRINKLNLFYPRANQFH